MRQLLDALLVIAMVPLASQCRGRALESAWLAQAVAIEAAATAMAMAMAAIAMAVAMATTAKAMAMAWADIVIEVGAA